MKTNYAAILSFLLILGLLYFSFYTHKPQNISGADTPITQFSTVRAQAYVDSLAQMPHAVGMPAHQNVQDYVVKTLENLGLEVEIQSDFAYKPGWGALSRAENIITKIPGDGTGQTLLLMSHYDSAPHTDSRGASDAGSGVAAILEIVRAHIAKGETSKNDIIILFTDAEELGLNGASVFVNKHPWAKDVDLALNFEARGSGGPSNMIVETNGGNGALIKAFAKANPSHPYANSLMYSVYKLLPNDTDSTVLRENGDIDGFFFAFIGDHFDYHTANDIPSRLDPESLEHQGRYLTALLDYFKDANLNLKADEDYVYFNLPLLKMVYYPFSFILPMLVVAWILFFVVLLYGIRKKEVNLASVGRGFLPLLIALIFAYILNLGWKLILALDPAQADILQGFPYNGYELLAGFVALMLAITFLIYYFFYRPNDAAALSFAPLFFWLLIATGVGIYLEGASFFVIPVYFGLLSIFLILRSGKPYLLLLTLLCAPALFIIAHYIKEFPVGLGLKMLVAAMILTVLLFGLLLPIMGYYKMKAKLAILFTLVSIGAFISAYAKSDFTQERRFPNSLNYVYDADSGATFYATYNTHLDDWLKQTLGENPKIASEVYEAPGSGKYGSRYTFAKEAPKKFIAPSQAYTSKDTIIDGKRHLNFSIFPQRNVNDMVLLVSQETVFNKLSFNGQEVEARPGEAYPLADRNSNYLLSYRLTNREPLEVHLITESTTDLNFTLLDYSYDLLENPDFDLPSRPKNTMPMPFVNTDARITIQRIAF
ncbi:M20/M25/M40 family metallo-hydrolase [Leeuwenhoekiella sp. W20_SRS_FM14]|uniref:M20/M25/M40 family metallo-hydrolase n=1 Tax=Leeuwenhoekiella sp. W20_SRS_FM14 TaxID=3240270 RepID=UPI003F971F35